MPRRTIDMDGEAAAKMEELARAQAFAKFLQEILFSCNLYRIDENIRKRTQHIKEWIDQCADKLKQISNRETNK